MYCSNVYMRFAHRHYVNVYIILPVSLMVGHFVLRLTMDELKTYIFIGFIDNTAVEIQSAENRHFCLSVFP